MGGTAGYMHGTAGYMHSTAGYMVVAYSILVSAPVLFGFRSYWYLVGVGPKGVLGLRVWGQGLTISNSMLEKVGNSQK